MPPVFYVMPLTSLDKLFDDLHIVQKQSQILIAAGLHKSNYISLGVWYSQYLLSHAVYANNELTQ